MCLADVQHPPARRLQVLLAVGGRPRVARALRGRLRLSWHYTRRLQVGGWGAAAACFFERLPAFGGAAGAHGLPAASNRTHPAPPELPASLPCAGYRAHT